MEKDRLGFPWLTHSRGSIIFLAKQSQGRKSSSALCALSAPQETCSWEGALLSPLAPSWPAGVLGGETEATQKWAHLPAPLFWPAWDQKLCCCIWGRQHQEGVEKSYQPHPLLNNPWSAQIYRALSNHIVIPGGGMFLTDTGKKCPGKSYFMLVDPAQVTVILFYWFQAEIFDRLFDYVLLWS